MINIKKILLTLSFCLSAKMYAEALELNSFLQNKSEIDKKISQLLLLANYREGELANLDLINTLHGLIEASYKSNEDLSVKQIIKSLVYYFCQRDDLTKILSSVEHPILFLFEEIINDAKILNNEIFEISILSDKEYQWLQKDFVQALLNEGVILKLQNAEGFFSQIQDKVFWYPPLAVKGKLIKKNINQLNLSINPNSFLLNLNKTLILELKNLKTKNIDVWNVSKFINEAIQNLLKNSWEKYFQANSLKLKKNSSSPVLSNFILELSEAFLLLENLKITEIKDTELFKSILNNLSFFLNNQKYCCLLELSTKEHLEALAKKLELITTNILLKDGQLINLFESIENLMNLNILNKENLSLEIRSIEAITLAIKQDVLIFNDDVFCLISLIASKTKKLAKEKDLLFVEKVIYLLKDVENKLATASAPDFVKTVIFQKRLNLQNKFALFSASHGIDDIVEMLSNKIESKRLKKRIYLQGLIFFSERLKQLSGLELKVDDKIINCMKIIIENILFNKPKSLNYNNDYDDLAILKASEICLLQAKNINLFKNEFFKTQFDFSIEDLLVIVSKQKAAKYCLLTEHIKL